MTSQLLKLMSSSWQSSIDIHCYYYDIDIKNYSLPKAKNIHYHNLEEIEDTYNQFLLRFNEDVEYVEKKMKPKVKLVGEDSNAFAILGKVQKALEKAGQKEEAKKFLEEATSGDYNNLLQTCTKWVRVVQRGELMKNVKHKEALFIKRVSDAKAILLATSGDYTYVSKSTEKRFRKEGAKRTK